MTASPPRRCSCRWPSVPSCSPACGDDPGAGGRTRAHRAVDLGLTELAVHERPTTPTPPPPSGPSPETSTVEPRRRPRQPARHRVGDPTGPSTPVPGRRRGAVRRVQHGLRRASPTRRSNSPAATSDPIPAELIDALHEWGQGLADADLPDDLTDDAARRGRR